MGGYGLLHPRAHGKPPGHSSLRLAWSRLSVISKAPAAEDKKKDAAKLEEKWNEETDASGGACTRQVRSQLERVDKVTGQQATHKLRG